MNASLVNTENARVRFGEEAKMNVLPIARMVKVFWEVSIDMKKFF